jgi:acetyltransferase
MQRVMNNRAPSITRSTGRHYLTRLFEPRAVAVVGASERPDAVGAIVLRNMIESGFAGGL